jgi:hypothetical protein
MIARGNVTIVGREEFFYLTDSRGFQGFVPTSNTTGTGIADANYAVWTRLSESDFTLVNERITVGVNVGLHGMQIVELLPVAKLGALTMGEDAELTYGAGLDAASFSSITAGMGATIHGNVSVRGVLAPGDGPGRFNVDGNFSMAHGSTYEWELGTIGDLVAVAGDLALNLWTLLLKDAGGSAVFGDQLILFTYTGKLENFGPCDIDTSLVDVDDRWNTAGVVIVNDTDNRRVYLTGLRVAPVPEPSTGVLLVLAFGGLLTHAWRSRHGRLHRRGQ